MIQWGIAWSAAFTALGGNKAEIVLSVSILIGNKILWRYNTASNYVTTVSPRLEMQEHGSYSSEQYIWFTLP